MDYSKVCYQIHSLAFNRFQTVNSNKSILNGLVFDLGLKTRAVLNAPQLDAITKNNSLPGFKLNNSKVLGKLNYPEIGLWASNYETLKAFAQSNYDYIMILEDDVLLDSNFINLMDGYFPQIPSDMDCFVIFNPSDIFFNEGYEKLNNESQYYTESEDIWVAHQTWSTAGLMFNKSGAQKVLNYIENEGVGMKYDEFILGEGFSQYQVSSNLRPLKVYSLSKDANRLASLEKYDTLIQGAPIIQNI